MRIAFLLSWGYGMGGLVRTTVNTANHLASRGHQVEIISFLRHEDTPFFEIRPDVTLTPLLDIRPDVTMGRAQAWLRGRASVFTPRTEPFQHAITLYGDYLLARKLSRLDADVLIATRPAWNLAATMWAPKRTLLIGQDHLNFTVHSPSLRGQMKEWYPRLDAMVTLTKADGRDYRKLLKKASTQVVAIGNAVTEGPHPRSTQDEKVVVSAGRLTYQKRYDHLIRAFALLKPLHPDWSLRLFGDGPHEERLRQVIADHDVGDSVTLMGRTSDTEAEFARASIMAMSSRYEGFPMVILEAFACGLPVVSYRCPRGPAEMINSGVDGLLVKDGSVGQLAGALRRLIEDPQRRRDMSAQALETADRHDIAGVGQQWEDLFAQLRANRSQRPARPLRRALTARVRKAVADLWAARR